MSDKFLFLSQFYVDFDLWSTPLTLGTKRLIIRAQLQKEWITLSSG